MKIFLKWGQAPGDARVGILEWRPCRKALFAHRLAGWGQGLGRRCATAACRRENHGFFL